MSILDELLGTANHQPRTPREATDPSDERRAKNVAADLAHPVIGADPQHLTPPPAASLDDTRYATERKLEQLERQTHHLAGLVEVLAELHRTSRERSAAFTDHARIGASLQAAYVVALHAHPFARLYVSSYATVQLVMPGQAAQTRELVPGWNTLDVLDATRIYTTGTAFDAIFQASDYPTTTPNPTAAAGYIALNSPPAQTNAGADTSLTFSQPVGHWIVQNNTAATVGVDLDSAASAGSLQIAAGATMTSDVPVAVLHLYTAGAQNINGTAAGNIVVRGWL